MNEITHIHLGRQPFTIAVDARRALRSYLDEIGAAVGDNTEVMNEVELRMAELLAGRGVTAEKVILKEDVEYLKTQLGEPADFGGEDGEEDQPKSKAKADAEADTTPKRLFRDTDHAMIAGVCAGLARYCNVDATIIRLIFVALIFFGGGGILLYAVLWLIVPEVKTTSDRLQMQGKAVTVDSLKRVVERADLEGAARRAGSVMSPVARAVARVILTALGFAFSLIAVFLLITVATTGFYAWVNDGIVVYGQHFFPIGLKETALLGAGLLATAIVALFFLLGGLTMLRPKWHAPGWLSAALGGMLVLTLAGGTALGLNVVPHLNDRYNALFHTATMPVQPFTQVTLNGKATDYVYVPDTAYKVVYTYAGKQSTAVIHDVQDGMLTIDGNSPHNPSCPFFCGYNQWPLVEIHAPHLSAVTVNGGGSNFSNDSAFKDTDFSLTTVHTATFNLRYINPGEAAFTSNPGQDKSQLVLSGLRTNAFDSDTISGYAGQIDISRASKVSLTTDATCNSGMYLIDLLSFPDSLSINGTDYTGKDALRAKQDTAKSNAANCVSVQEPIVYNYN